jgi:hypothetical protein
MDRDDAEGAAAAAAHFLRLRAPMMASGDTAEWAEMSHQACEFCTSGLEQAETIQERNDTYTGGDATTEAVEVYAMDPVTGTWPVEVRITEDASRIVNSSDEEVFASVRSTTRLLVEVGLRDGSWVIVGVGDAK